MRESAHRLGRYVKVTTGDERFEAYVPPSLLPPPALAPSLTRLHEQAVKALGNLDGVTHILPNIHLFVYQYVRKEALLSSQIEGTQSSLSDFLLYEVEAAPGAPKNTDIEEVSNYVSALQYALQRLEEGFPLSLRLIREIHGVLLSTGRGKDKLPGEFRKSQNWIGGTRPGNAVFVPPPPDYLMACLDDLEKFLHEEESGLPILIKAAVAHVQFETIHPFLDGNGRVGRLLIILMLKQAGLLEAPVLYLSLYFKTHRSTYYRLLNEVRETGQWDAWVEFFLTAVTETASNGYKTARHIVAMLPEHKARLKELGRAAANAHRVLDCMQQYPVVDIQWLAKQLHLAPATVIAALGHLMRLGIVKEITGGRRNQAFAYDEYLRLLSEGTEPLALS